MHPEADRSVNVGTEEEIWRLTLFVAGQSPRSRNAFANLAALCDSRLAGRYEIEVVDLIENPEMAEPDDIFALPTLVRRHPGPPRKLIGDLSNPERVLAALELR
jgi:circadian clock protein KaiB